ncbi:hypothetical protein JYU34_003654 [Plutella xylostella]|uniref:Secreted protein n=1 Tax=Plutella xylostella TaxID=51655 RepID=A0ABQ7R0K2_PLUXY|nr:hypothetical protein JYU34_003654 [Plutella xylostella]
MKCKIFFLMVMVALCVAAPQLQRGSQDTGSQQFIEEVVVESVLQVRSPSAGRQARTNTQTSLKDGARVAALKSN